MNRILIIDGNALLHRAYHALPDFKTKDGVPTNAVYGFASVLHSIRQDLAPTHVVVCFDTPEPTFRDELFKEYRTHRPETEENLVKQFPMVREFLDAAGVARIEHSGMEADDLIAVVARKAVEKHIPVVILTADKDIFQLINDKIAVLTPTLGFAKGTLYDKQAVIDKFGVPPEKIPDLKALVGDPSDNYKGVKGIGPKGAVELIQKYGSIEEIYAKIDSIDNPRLKTLLEAEKDQALMCKKLAVLVNDIPGLAVSLDDYRFEEYKPALREFFIAYDFNTFQKRFFSATTSKPVVERPSNEEKNQLGLF